MPGLTKNTLFKWSRLSLWLLAFIYLWVFVNFSTWKRDKVIVWDAYEYYLYLPSAFIHHNFDLDWAMPELQKIGEGFHWDFLSPTGKPVGRMSMGLAILYSPFFLMGHATAVISGAKADGFSSPYYFFMLLGTLVYALLGNLLLRKVLLRWFTDEVTAFTLLLLNLGTNLFYFVTTEPLITHVAGFCLLSAFLYLMLQWYERKDWLTSLLLGHVAGMIVLIRPTNMVLIAIFLFWDITSLAHIGQRVLLFWNNRMRLFMVMLSAFLVFVPQFIYWKLQTGQWYYYSYGFLGAFYFDTPHFWDGLFSYRKGWLLYTPVMVFALLGMLWLRKFVKQAALIIPVLTLIHFYVVVSFWCWWYGAGFGLRPMIDMYPFLALPLAACIGYLGSKKWLRIPAVFVLGGFMLINQIQTYQARKNILHYDSVTREYYWAVFMRLDNAAANQHLLQAPDYFKAVKNQE